MLRMEKDITEAAKLRRVDQVMKEVFKTPFFVVFKTKLIIIIIL